MFSKKFVAVLVGLMLVAAVGTVALADTGDAKISNILQADVTSTLDEPVQLTWALDTTYGTQPDHTGFTTESQTLNLTVGEPIYLWVKAANDTESTIERVQFRIETDEVFTIERTATGDPDFAGALPYEDGAYRYGSAEVNLEPGYVAASEFKITAHTEVTDLNVQVYAVQLAE